MVRRGNNRIYEKDITGFMKKNIYTLYLTGKEIKEIHA